MQGLLRSFAVLAYALRASLPGWTMGGLVCGAMASCGLLSSSWMVLTARSRRVGGKTSACSKSHCAAQYAQGGVCPVGLPTLLSSEFAELSLHAL